MTLPLPGEPVPSDVSVVTHADRFDGNPASSFGPTWDYDENTEGTYISYFDLMPAPSGVDPDYIVTGTDAGDLIDGTYVDPTDVMSLAVKMPVVRMLTFWMRLRRQLI